MNLVDLNINIWYDYYIIWYDMNINIEYDNIEIKTGNYSR